MANGERTAQPFQDDVGHDRAVERGQDRLAVDEPDLIAGQMSVADDGRRNVVQNQRGKIAFLAGQDVADKRQARHRNDDEQRRGQQNFKIKRRVRTGHHTTLIGLLLRKKIGGMVSLSRSVRMLSNNFRKSIAAETRGDP